MYYILILISTVLFSLQFLANQGFQRTCGNTFKSAMRFTAESTFVAFFVMTALSGFQLKFTWFSLLMALALAGVIIALSYCSIKALKTVNLSTYSVFMMLGGMLLPFLLGILVYKEPFTLKKVISCVLIGVALFFTVEKSSNNKRAYKYYVACFILNGLSGVVSKIHQSNITMAVSSQNFLSLVNMEGFIICMAILLLGRGKNERLTLREFKFSAEYAIFNGMGSLLLLIALRFVPASVQYPCITGGTIVFSTLISYLQKEKLSARIVFAVLLAVLSTIVIAI